MAAHRQQGRELREIPEGAELQPFRPGEVPYRDFELRSGDFLHAVVEQHGIDLALTLRGPDGTELLRVDSPNGRRGLEELVTIAETPGRYRLELRSSGEAPEPGRYRLGPFVHRPAGDRDRLLAAGDRLQREGRRLAGEGAAEAALERLRAALEIWRRLALPAREADTLRQKGTVHHRLDDLPAARDAWEQALSWYRLLGERRRSFLLYDLGRLSLQLGDPAAATPRLEEALELFREQEELRGEAAALSALGTAYRTRGYLQRAVELFDQAAERVRRLERPRIEALVQVERAALMLELDRPEEALESYQRALELYRGMGDARSAAVALRGIADAGVRSGDLDLAEAAAREALSVLGEEGEGRARAAALSALGNARRKRGDWAGARRALEQALELARTGGHRRDQAVILTTLAYVQAEAGEPEGALPLYGRALEIFRAMGSRSGEAMVLGRSAEALRDLGRLEEAHRRLETALEQVEEARSETRRQDLRLTWFGSRQDYYETAVDVLLRLHAADPGAGHDRRALAVHERRLARELEEALALEADPRTEVDPALAAEERRLEAELSRLAGRLGISEESDAAERAGALVERLHRLRGEMRARRESAAPMPASLQLAGLRASLLDERTLVLVYSLGDDGSALFSLSTAGLAVHRLPGRAAIEERAAAFAEALRQTHARSVARREELGAGLGRTLLGPVAAELAATERLVVVAGGALDALPFAALTVPDGSSRFVVESHEVVAVPSLTLLAKLRREREDPAAARRLALFADPVFGPDDPRVGGRDPSEKVGGRGPATGLPAEPGGNGGGFRRLPGFRREAETVRTLWGDKPEPWVATGFDARRETLLEGDWSGFGALYFATHAVAQPRPETSGLALSMVDREGHRLPGFVTALEIARLHLPVDLVVLSACETGAGRAVRGEGSLSLAWSFLQAGAARVVASLWRVDDRRTAALMTRLIELHRGRGLSAAAALRGAQVEILREPGTLPFDWAGFVLTGDPGPPAGGDVERRTP